jgi:cystathionine gamma-synthase
MTVSLALENDIEVGETLPPMTEHVSQTKVHYPTISLTWPQAVSVSLPTWKANVGYEEGEEWVLSKMKTGYPRYVYNHELN